MFGVLRETQASCGHWVVWDSKAEHTAYWGPAYVSSRKCQSCQINDLHLQYEKTLEAERVFIRREVEGLIADWLEREADILEKYPSTPVTLSDERKMEILRRVDEIRHGDWRS